MLISNVISQFSALHASVLLVLILIFRHIYNKWRDPVQNCGSRLPGPFALPLVGNDGTGELFRQYSKKYGSIYRLWIGNHLTVVVTKSEYLEAIFPNSRFLNKSELFWPFKEFWGEVLFTAPADIWKISRKNMLPFFTKKNAQLYVDDMNNVINRHVRDLEEKANGLEFDLSDAITSLFFDVMTKILFDLELTSTEKKAFDFNGCVSTAGDITNRESFLPWLRIKSVRNLLYGKKIQRCKNRMMEFSKKVFDEKMAPYIRFEETERGNDLDHRIPQFLKIIYELSCLKKDDQMSYVLDQIADMLAAGSGTSTLSCLFFLMSISMHRSVQDKVYDEIREKLGEDERPVDVSDIDQLTYLDQVMKETWRKFAVLPVIMKKVEEDVKIGDITLPVGITVLINIDGVHHTEQYYPNADEFDPENFSPSKERNSKYEFIPFSAGPRDCIGKSISNVVLKLAIVTLLRRFEFQTKMKLADLKLNYGFVLTPIDGFVMSIKRRTILDD